MTPRRLLLGAVALIPGVAGAALPPSVLQQMRDEAPNGFAGTVVEEADPRPSPRDLAASVVRVDRVERGPLRPGDLVTFDYLEDAGQEKPAGPDCWYEAFEAGDRVAVFGGFHGTSRSRVDAVTCGIDVLSRAPRSLLRDVLPFGALGVALVVAAVGAWAWKRRARAGRS